MTDFEGKPFTDTLGEIENGAFLSDLTAQFYEVVRAAMETRKAGALTIAIKVVPTGRASVKLDAAISAKVPEHDRPSTTFFVTPEGTTLRDDPEQPKLPLRQVDTPRNDPIQVRS